jgi:ribosomal protein S17
VLFIVAYNGSGAIRSLSSINIRAVSKKNPAEGEVVVNCGDKTAIVKKGDTIKLPDITESKDGFKILGWTTGDNKVYKPGDTVVINENTYFYVRWQRLDLDNLMVL